MLAEQAAANSAPYLVVTFGNADTDWADEHPKFQGRFEKAGPLFKAIKNAGCDRVVFAGGMERPKLNPLRFDAKFLRVSSKLLPALKGGDDQTLRVIARIFETEGLTIVAAHDLLGGLLATAGVPTRIKPSDADRSDAHRAAEIVQGLSTLDIGQGAIVAQGTCLATESIQGTDVMLRFAAHYRDDYRPDPMGGRGVLFKAPKTNQDRRMDLPAIGPQTMRLAAEAGLAGIVTVSGGALILDQAELVSEADRLGMFLWVQEA